MLIAESLDISEAVASVRTSRWKEAWKAAQCSRSIARRIFSPIRAASLPHAPSHTASFQAKGDTLGRGDCSPLPATCSDSV